MLEGKRAERAAREGRPFLWKKSAGGEVQDSEKEYGYKIVKLKSSFEVCYKILKGATILGSLWIIMHFCTEIVAHSPEQISALATVISAIKMETWFPWICTVIVSGAWGFERHGKKRAIRKASRLQKELERNDPGRTSSGLTETGDTPKEDEV